MTEEDQFQDLEPNHPHQVFQALLVLFSLVEDDLDMGGELAVLHPIRVMVKVPDHAAVALLHDILEDTELTAEDLRTGGFATETVDAVEALTHPDGEPYQDYLNRIKQNPVARVVKIADLEDNLSRPPVPDDPEGNERREKKHKKALAFLLEEE